MDIQRDHRTTLLFISHDLSVVRYLSDRVVVMYLGQIMEQGTTGPRSSRRPTTPIPRRCCRPCRSPMRGLEAQGGASGEIPSASNPPKGCPFSTRCPYMIPGTCDVIPPPLVEPSPGHKILCHLSLETLEAMEPVITVSDAAVPPHASGEVSPSAAAESAARGGFGRDRVH
jgi:peptide/nickel transport system ATP-binding protein